MKGSIVIYLLYLLKYFFIYHINQITHKLYSQIHLQSSLNPLKKTTHNSLSYPLEPIHSLFLKLISSSEQTLKFYQVW